MTLTPELNPLFSMVFLAGTAVLLAAELVGAFLLRGRGDTITEHWRWVDRVAHGRSRALGWTWRVFTAGLLAWAFLHLLFGI